MVLHSTTSSSTFGVHTQHPQPLRHLNLMNSMPQWMVGHPPATQTLMDNMLLQHYLRCLWSRLAFMSPRRSKKHYHGPVHTCSQCLACFFVLKSLLTDGLHSPS